MENSHYMSDNPQTLADIKTSTFVSHDPYTNSSFYVCDMKNGSTTMLINNHDSKTSIMCDMPSPTLTNNSINGENFEVSKL